MDKRSAVLIWYRAASGDTWYHVPGYGPVNWSVEQITEHARYLWETHRPDQPAVRVRLGWGILPLVWPARHCKVCCTAWVCREARWASWWLDSLEDGWRFLVEAGS